MSATENKSFAVAKQLGGRFKESSPEQVIYGYSKLASMNDAMIKSIISEDSMEDINGVRNYFHDKKLDLDLIKSGFPLIYPHLFVDEEAEKAYDLFVEYLGQCTSDTPSAEILDHAANTTVIPVFEVFAEGKTSETVFEYQNELIAKFPQLSEEEDADAPENDRPEDSDEGEKPADRPVGGAAVRKAPEEEEEKSLLALSEKYQRLSASLLDVVWGQDPAVNAFVRGCFQGEIADSKKDRPRAHFFFLGPPGVGKTFLAETAAEQLGLAHYTFNMAEYTEYSSKSDLIGISEHYQGAREGTLVEFVRKHPKCVVIFDEIEKAHKDVIRTFLEMLGTGFVYNVYRREKTDFRKAIVIFTSNAGRSLYEDRTTDLSSLPVSVIVDALRDTFPGEVCSRLAAGNVIMFNHLSFNLLSQMTNASFMKLVDEMQKTYHCRLSYSSYLPLLFMFHNGNGMDARVATAQSSNFLKNELFELIRQINDPKLLDPEIMTSIRFDIDMDEIDPEMKKLFVNESKAEILLVTEETDKDNYRLQDEKYTAYQVSTLKEAKGLLKKKDIAAVFIDINTDEMDVDQNILSAADYKSAGIRIFHGLVETNSGMPVYILDTEDHLSQIDKQTFLQEGAREIISVRADSVDANTEIIRGILDNLYMEQTGVAFIQQGWVLDYKTLQDISRKDEIRIVFYDLKKKRAIDSHNRGMFLSDVERPDTVFDDVIGADNAKDKLRHFIGYLKNPKQFLASGEEPAKGVLLYGPPGTGKTMLARAMAGESSVCFIETNAAKFKTSLYGESEKAIRDLFAVARKYAPSIVFIDEIDVIGKKRTGGETNRLDESLLTTLLTEMDGFNMNIRKPVFVLAATNFGVGREDEGIDSLDQALLRRFDNLIYVDLPNLEERKYFLVKQREKRKLSGISDGAIDNIVERTTGQSIANLQHILKNAIEHAHREKRHVEDNDLLNALEEFLFGEKKESSPEYYRQVAIHEAGHALVSYLNGSLPTYITIESRGNFGGYVQHENKENTSGYTKNDLVGRIQTALAGRAAEVVFLGEDTATNTGASSDLKTASDIALNMIFKYGMIQEQFLSLNISQTLLSPVAGRYLDMANDVLKEQMQNAIRLIRDNQSTLQKIVDQLIVQNHLTGEELQKIFDDCAGK